MAEYLFFSNETEKKKKKKKKIQYKYVNPRL